MGLETTNHVISTSVHGVVERRPAVLSRGVDISTVLQQQVDHAGMTRPLSAMMYGLHPLFCRILCAGVGSALE